MIMPSISPDAIKRMLLQGGDPSSLLQPDPSAPNAPGAPGAPGAPNASPSAGTIAQAVQNAPASSTGPTSPGPQPGPQSTPAAASAAAAPTTPAGPASLQDYVAQFGHAPIEGAPPPVPQHGTLYKIFNTLGRVVGNPMAQQAAQRDFDLKQQNIGYQRAQPVLQEQADRAAYEHSLGEQHTAAETRLSNTQADIAGQNLPVQEQAAKVHDELVQRWQSQLDPDADSFQQYAQQRLAAEPAPIQRRLNGDPQRGIPSPLQAITRLPRMGSKYTLTRDPQTQAPIELVDRQGNHYSQSNLPKDPEAQQMWNDAATAAANKEQVEEGKEKRVAGYAADRQAQAFSNQQTEQGKKAAATSIQDINDAKNQQTMIQQLLGGKMNPTSQTAAMFKMIGLEQPTGTHRIMPAEIEGIEQQGGLTDRLKQKLLNWKEGDRFDPDLIPDVISTAKVLSNNKLKTANDNLESTARIYGYKAPGSDAKGRFDKPEDYQTEETNAGAAQHVPGGKAQGLKEGATGTGSDGKKYVVKGGVWVPAGK